MALRPILAHYQVNPDDVEGIARILVEAVSFAQSVPFSEPADLRYKMAAQFVISQSRA